MGIVVDVLFTRGYGKTEISHSRGRIDGDPAVSVRFGSGQEDWKRVSPRRITTGSDGRILTVVRFDVAVHVSRVRRIFGPGRSLVHGFACVYHCRKCRSQCVPVRTARLDNGNSGKKGLTVMEDIPDEFLGKVLSSSGVNPPAS